MKLGGKRRDESGEPVVRRGQLGVIPVAIAIVLTIVAESSLERGVHEVVAYME